jgi:hypothetical protein
MNKKAKPTNCYPVPRRLAVFCAAVVSLGSANSLTAAPTPRVAVEEVPSTKSVFVDRANFGRDPFYPNSTRRKSLEPVPSEPVVVNFGNLALKGVSGTAERRLAIINNKTFEVGEEAELRVSGQVVKVKCTEIRAKSVIISVNGVTRELLLGSKF